ncbi:amidohydrolase family protein [Rathayibacter sp. KR2-224]|uniref:amidohydrolase family protein n=1 Tax=Rathayibacter sp. KR2-224 TaxID=3400913 RepID=UPI003BFD265D
MGDPEAPPRSPLVDAHVHVWNPARLSYPWLRGFERLDRPFLPNDIDRAGGATTRHVFVQAGCRVEQASEEVRWVTGMTDAWPELAAIVADADLRSGSGLESHLDALVALGERDARLRRVRVAGIRHLLQDEPDELLNDSGSTSALLDGLRVLAERAMTFDVCVRHRQLDTVIDVLERVPELNVVLDHLGKPPVDDGIHSTAGHAWARAIDRLALLPRAHVKLSGLAAEASSSQALDDHAHEFLAHALRAFAPQRSMIGSDWPVSALTGAGGTFAGWRERVMRATLDAGFEDADLAAIEHVTAERFYSLS